MAKKKKTKVGSFLKKAADKVKSVASKVTNAVSKVSKTNLGAAAINAVGVVNPVARSVTNASTNKSSSSQPVFQAKVGENLNKSQTQQAYKALGSKGGSSGGSSNSPRNMSVATGGFYDDNGNFQSGTPGVTPGAVRSNITYSFQSGRSSKGTSNFSSPLLAQASAPDSADGIQSGFSSPSTPSGSTSGYMGNPMGAKAATVGAQARVDSLMAAEDQRRAEEVERMKLEQEDNKNWLQKLMEGPKIDDMREDAFEDIGVDPQEYFADQKARIAEIDSLNVDYANLEAAKNQQIAQTMDKMASMNFINNQVQQIERNAAPQLALLSAKINSKAATMEALQGNFNEARDFVNQAVDDALSDRTYEFNLMKEFQQMNSSLFDKIDKKYTDAFNTKLQIAKDELDQERADKETIGQLMMDNPRAGISIVDSLETAFQKVARSGGSLDYQREQRIGSEGNGNGVDSGDIETYAQAYLDGDLEITNIPERFRAGAIKRANEIANEALASQAVEPIPEKKSGFNIGGLFKKNDDTKGSLRDTMEKSFFGNLFGS